MSSPYKHLSSPYMDVSVFNVNIIFRLELPEDNFVQFSNSEERVIGTDVTKAHVRNFV